MHGQNWGPAKDLRNLNIVCACGSDASPFVLIEIPFLGGGCSQAMGRGQSVGYGNPSATPWAAATPSTPSAAAAPKRRNLQVGCGHTLWTTATS